MYRLLVVDDESRDRNIVRILVEKQYPGMFEILEAKSGAQALNLFKQHPIDLLLLDLNMPGLSGMGVIREVQSSTYVIILTAYSFFDYAREALHYGVKDYVLKPPIRSELYGAIDRFLKVAPSQGVSTDKGRRILTRELATQLLFYSNEKKIQNFLSLLGIQPGSITLGVFPTDPPQEDDQLLDAVEKLLDAAGVPYAAAAFRNGVAALLFQGPDADLQTLESLRGQLTRQTAQPLRLETATDIGAFADVPRAFIRICEQERADRSVPESIRQTDQLEAALRKQDFSGAMRCIAAEMDAWDYQTQSNTVKFQLISALSKSTNHLFANADKRGAYTRLSTLLGAADKEQLVNGAAEYLHWLIEEIQKSVYTNSYVVHRVIDAVKLDCAKSWTIDGLAADMKISPYYLSHLFKDHTGRSFTDYLTECRLERAVELMRQPELTLAQIGEAVGYADQNYFSRVFKKRRGIGARQFRKQLLAE